MTYVSTFYLFYFVLFISSLFKDDLHLAYKKPINVNSNTAYISVNKLPSNSDNKTKYLIGRQNQHVANRLYITYMSNQASTFLFFVWKILGYHNFWLFLGQVSIFLEPVSYGIGTISYRTGISTLKNVYFPKIIRDSLIDFKYVIHT